jgi:hypothetical protein
MWSRANPVGTKIPNKGQRGPKKFFSALGLHYLCSANDADVGLP